MADFMPIIPCIFIIYYLEKFVNVPNCKFLFIFIHIYVKITLE